VASAPNRRRRSLDQGLWQVPQVGAHQGDVVLSVRVNTAVVKSS